MCKKECNAGCEKCLLEENLSYEINLPSHDDIKNIAEILNDIDNFMDLGVKAGVSFNSLGHKEKSVKMFETLVNAGNKVDELAKVLNEVLENISEVSDMIEAYNERKMRGDA